jgi:hypothetical protein
VAANEFQPYFQMVYNPRFSAVTIICRTNTRTHTQTYALPALLLQYRLRAQQAYTLRASQPVRKRVLHRKWQAVSGAVAALENFSKTGTPIPCSDADCINKN